MDHCWMLTLVLVTYFCLFESASTEMIGNIATYKTSSFQNPDIKGELNHVLLHSTSGNVYVGAVNTIYRLDNNLEHQKNASILSTCEDEQNCVNHNEILFVEPLRNALITCGSYTGQCQLRHIEELTVTDEIDTIVASNEDKTTIGILAPGPGNIDWLYVAATFISTSPKNSIPPVSRRTLGLEVPVAQLLFARTGVDTVNFNNGYKSDPFDITYVYGFSYNGFVYYVTHQNGLSKVVRVCQAGPNLEAYTEITIQCGQGSSEYPLAQAAYVGPAGPNIATSLGIDSSDLMLYAVFTKEDNSALCMFSMTDIEDAFLTAVDNCVKGNEGVSVVVLQGNRCGSVTPPGGSTPYLCDTSGLYQYADNPNAVEATPLLEQAGTMMSSIATSIEMNYTIAFIGTSSGDLLKVHIENGTSARYYECIDLGDAPVLRDISFDDTKQEINILTEQQLLKLKVESCGQYLTCETCIGMPDSDPYCGWCTLENKCSRQDDCKLADETRRWLSYNVVQCVEISAITPFSSLPITEPQREITLTVEQLPVLQDGQTYSCQFNDLQRTQGTTVGNTVNCRIPEINARPPIPALEDNVKMTLSVYSAETSMNFVSADFNFYDCTHHQKCGECVESSWDCDWCVFDNKCTHRSSECRAAETIVTGKYSTAGGKNRGPEFCPQIQPQGGEVLVPVDISRKIAVNVSNLPETDMINYKCSLLVEGVPQSVRANKISENVIECNSKAYTYKANDMNELIAQLSISWNNTREFDDFNIFNVTLYKCYVDRRDCSRCLAVETARPELECRWCGTKCSHIDNAACSNSALEPGSQCPAPKLEQVFPKTGPLEGNTVIAVMGTNIGQQFQDVQSVMVGQQACDLTGLEAQYITGHSVSCLTAPMNGDIEQTITIAVASVDGGADLASTGTVTFNYRNPEITSFEPVVGPAAGGTRIAIMGQHMNTGRDIKAMIDTNVACDVINKTNSQIVCHSGNSTVGRSGLISVTFDGAERNSQESFTYQPNPRVSAIQPQKSVESGGRLVNVTGVHFEQIQSPIIRMSADREFFDENCTVKTDTLIMCKTPNVSSAFNGSRSATDTQDAGFTVGFMLAINFFIELDTFTYVKDPVFYRFEGDGNIHDLEGSKLQIQGERLDDALTESEVKVFVGSANCTVDVLANSILSCTPPKNQPRPIDSISEKDTNNLLPTVYVQYGEEQVMIGYVRYNTELDLGLYIGIAAAVLLLPIVAVAIFLWRKLRGSRKEIGEILLQMDDLEKGMAEDLRIAFAELQTNVTDLTHDLAGTGMPFVSHRQYATNMLFTGLDIQPMTSDPENPEERTERAMVQFNKLLVNKTFLLAFIQALDEDKKITVKDKSTIASLLTVIMMLENKLGYLTDIMITLMSNQVGEAVDNNRPKQLFRRTESIVEKLLSNWIALCLYDQLQDRTAFPLFLLYSGIKVQTEKGPVDAVTRQAHFSLSEERLLRGSVDFKEMTLKVVVDSEDGEKKEVRVMDVDAIPQVKEKILDSMYRNKPYSNRQRASTVNLEWRQGRSGRLVLQDAALPQMALGDDKQTENLQKLNTLKELGIPDNSLMALVPKETLHTSINEATSGYGPNDANVFPRDTEQENGTVLWHLEKPQDDVEESEKQQKKRKKELALTGNKKSRDITFPRLLTMKGIIQDYVDNMFQAILTVESTPMAIKYLFDFFDSQASRHDMEDPDIVHIWKSNTFPLRFWVSSITHPNYIFDIRPTPSVESSLGVVGQAFYDACNKSDHQLGWESSVNKLLYNREVTRYRGQVESYYQGIADMERIETSDLQREFDKTCQNFTGLFSKLSTLLQLYEFTNRNKDLLLRAIEEDDICEQENLSYELEQVENILQDE
ncbi:plexin-A2-like [Asterias amurensis]|uniref:plexin-A2-like n=1 Tax=Asterias amurensis TaxID=7602 RepID=UPI003AB53B23